ncbi:MAG: hypothetical protein P8N19_00890 [Flavobacteriales bacterium]|nr:hypothetical protein [Flavobacteriales bacterium]
MTTVPKYILNLFFTFSFLVLISSRYQAQNVQVDDDIKVLFSHEISGGLHLHTAGGGLFGQYAKYQDASNLLLFGFEMLYMKHEKEIRSFNPVYDDSRSYVIGKQNSFFVFRPSIGKQRIITSKQRKSGVRVGYSWHLGPSLGVTKPVYLEIGYPSIPYEYLAVEKYDPAEHFSNNIYGRASALNGLDELKLHPGAFVKFALNFEYSSENDGLKGLEVGAVLDAYATDIPILADLYGTNKQFFLNAYVNFFFGRKYIIR